MCCFHLCEMSKVDYSTDTESTLVAAGRFGGGVERI
jgi:hypothetical protein